MRISIANRLKPFSHVPGAQCIIPGTDFILEAFPALLKIGNLKIHLEVKGPVRDFTVQQDLEKNCVWVFGESFHIQVTASPDGFTVQDRNGKRFFPVKIGFSLPQEWERLSLGSHKKQDWDPLWQRGDLRDILPVLYGLGQKIPHFTEQPLTGTGRLLEFNKVNARSGLEIFCRAAFHHILVPRLRDDQYQGLCPDEEVEGNPFYLIQEATRLIRSLFFHQENHHLHLLPFCPFDSGRFVNMQAHGIGSFDLEWLKGKLSGAILRAKQNCEIALTLQKEIGTFRIRNNTRERGRKCKASDPLFVEVGQTYFLDRFQTL